LDGLDRLVEDLGLALLQLVAQVDLARGDEGVDARAAPLRPLEGLGGALDVQRRAARERRHLDRYLAPHGAHGLEVAFARDPEAAFEDVHAQLRELVRHAHLLGHGHAAARGLLTVAKGRIEDKNAVSGRRRHRHTAQSSAPAWIRPIYIVPLVNNTYLSDKS